MRANRRWEELKRNLTCLDRQSKAAGEAKRKALSLYYWPLVEWRAHHLGEPSAWALVERLKKYGGIDLSDELQDLLQRAMTSVSRPKPVPRLTRRQRNDG